MEILYQTLEYRLKAFSISGIAGSRTERSQRMTNQDTVQATKSVHTFQFSCSEAFVTSSVWQEVYSMDSHFSAGKPEQKCNVPASPINNIVTLFVPVSIMSSSVNESTANRLTFINCAPDYKRLRALRWLKKLSRHCISQILQFRLFAIPSKMKPQSPGKAFTPRKL